MFLNDVIPAEVAVSAPKSTRGRKPSKWQLTPCKLGVHDGETTVYYSNEKKAKAVVAYARAFGYIPDDQQHA